MCVIFYGKITYDIDCYRNLRQGKTHGGAWVFKAVK